MGVSGLLPLLKSIQKPTELKKYSGQTLGVDGYGWLHRAAYSCALELGQGKPTQKYVKSAMHRVRMLRHFGVTPYLVFDGDYLPSKAATEDSREKRREEKKKVAMELLRAGKPAQATQEFQKCIDVTPEMASAWIQELEKLGISYVVAPYEADAQLVYLEQQGLIDGILSDDSDLLVFGAKKLLTKLDQYGNCIEINRKDFCRCKQVSLTGWSDAEFRRMAILSGCDYLDGLPGMGLKTAYRMLRTSKTPERVVRMVQLQGKRVSENYLTQFYQAELTFLHQWVFCPTKKGLVHLTELDGTRTADEMPFIGAYVEPEMARNIAKGSMNPITKVPIRPPTTPSKRKHSQTSNDTTVRPPMKPITSFFKGHHRVPMGEMDPNCFEVDPQRVAQITGGGLVPRVFPLPRPYLDDASAGTAGHTSPTRTRASPRTLRRRTEPITNLLTRMTGSPPVSRRASSGNPSSDSPPLSVSSDPLNRPPKKARLCNENEPELPNISPKKSRFFSASRTRKSPRKSPRRAKSEAYLFSDDSLDEALRDLPDFEGWKPAAKPRKTISIFEESSQETVTTSADTESQQSTAKTDETPMSSFSASMPPPQSKASRPQPAATPRPSLSRFSYSESSATPSSTISKAPSSIFSAVSTPPTAPSTAASRMTPLQRLGALAMSKPASPKLPKPRKSLDKFLPGVPVNPAFVPLPKVDLNEVEALNTSYGSEDQIIPDSEEEDEELAASPKKLNLSRFAYA